MSNVELKREFHKRVAELERNKLDALKLLNSFIYETRDAVAVIGHANDTVLKQAATELQEKIKSVGRFFLFLFHES